MPSGHDKSPDYGDGPEPPEWYNFAILALCFGAPVFIAVYLLLKFIPGLFS